MINYKFQHYNFIKRFLSHAKIFLFGILVAYVAGITLTGHFWLCAIVAGLFVVIILGSLYKWNIYFIEQIDFWDNKIYLKVYKFDKIFIDETFDLNEVNFKANIASSSKRGSTYKLIGLVPHKEFIQYEIMGWKSEFFFKIIELKEKSKNPVSN